MSSLGRDNSHDTPRIMKVTDLPPEIVDLVVVELPRDSLKPLRLAHSIFKYATEQRLFSTVVISKTKRDLASLLGIAGTARLAAIPTRLVWYELTEDHNHFLRFPKKTRSVEPSYSDRVAYMLHDLIADAFWTEPFLADDDPDEYKRSAMEWVATKEALYLSRREISQASTEKAIGEAVRKLVNLHTLVAQPMPVDRVLAISDRGYHLDGDVLKNVMDQDAAYLPNGLFLFSRACLGDDLTNRIHSLYLSGPFTRPSVFARYYSTSDDVLALFKNLTTIDLCMTWIPEVENNEGPDQAEMSGHFTLTPAKCLPMAKCLQAATNLQHLTICLEGQMGHRIKVGLLETVLFTDVGQEEQNRHGGQQPIWPILHSLHLTEAVYKERQLVDFMARHAAKLRHLSLMDCSGHSTLIAAGLAAIPNLELSSFKVRSNNFHLGQAHAAREDYLVPEEALLTFINKTSNINPLATTKRKVFSTGPFIWDPQSWPAVAYFDLAACHARHNGPMGDVPGLGLPGESGIDLARQDEIMSTCNSTSDLGNGDRPSQQDRGEWYYATDSSEAECELGIDGMHDDDGAWPPRRKEVAVPVPYDEVDRAWITAWAKQTAQDEYVDLDRVTTEPLGRDEPKWKTPWRQSRLLKERAADIRHLERCRGENTETNPRWCWMRVNYSNKTADNDDKSKNTTDQEIYYWKTNDPERGHATTNWTFHKTLEDGTARHGFGADPLDFFSDWDSDSGKGNEGSDSDVEEEEEENDANNPKKKTMHAEPSVYSRAFKRFLADPFDQGDPLEANVEVIRLGLEDDSDFEDEDEDEDDDSNEASQSARRSRHELLGAVRGHTVKNMVLVGVTVDVLPAKVGMLVPKQLPKQVPPKTTAQAAPRVEAAAAGTTAATAATANTANTAATANTE